MNSSWPDIRTLLALLLKRKDILIAVGIIIISGLLAKNLYQEQKRKISQTEKGISSEKEKIDLEQEVSALNKEMAQKGGPYYKSGSPLSVEKIEELAALSKVSLILVIPVAERDMGFCTVSGFKLSMKASYFDLGKFVSMVEPQGGIVKIVKFSARREERPPSGARMAGRTNPLKIDMEISHTFVKQ